MTSDEQVRSPLLHHDEQVRPQMEQACWACLNSYFVQRLVQAELDDSGSLGSGKGAIC